MARGPTTAGAHKTGGLGVDPANASGPNQSNNVGAQPNDASRLFVSDVKLDFMLDPTNVEAMKQLGPEILRRVAHASSHVLLVCPYVTNTELVDALKACSAPVRRLVTRLEQSDIVSGATSLACLRDLVDAGVDVRTVRSVHAKVYVLDEWAYVGSANLTGNGLQAGLREFGRGRRGRHAQVATAYFEALWEEAEQETPHKLALVAAQVDAMRDDLDAARARLRELADRLSLPERTRPTPERSPELNLVPALPRGDFVLTARFDPVRVESSLILVAGGKTAAQAIARLICGAIKASVDFRRSEHWTLNVVNERLRLTIGMVEFVVLDHGYFWFAAQASACPAKSKAALDAVGARVFEAPHKNLLRLDPDALWSRVDANVVHQVEGILRAGLQGIISLDTKTWRTMHRKAFSPEAVRAVASLAGDPEIAELAAGPVGPGDE